MNSNVRIVLVRPRNPLNIGAAARAMANFGFSDLVVVKPYPPVWRETVSAVGAEKLVLAAKAVRTLEEAVDDRHLVFGTTTTRRRKLERPLVRLPELPAELRRRRGASRIALVFGPEKTGLSNRHLRQCHCLLTVPTSDDCPSMNLGQAVATCCYELSRGRKDFGRAKAPDAGKLPTSGEIRRLVTNAMEVFDATGYLDFLPAEEREFKLRRMLLGWGLKRHDLALLHGALRFVLKGTKK
jgi:TrmH family RNA methyltransferase